MRLKNSVKVRGEEALMVREQIVSGILETSSDFQMRTLYLTNTIDFDLASKFIVALAKMDETVGTIRVVLMSAGGAEIAGWAIYDMLRGCRNSIVIDAIGAAQSMSALILQAGDVRRMSRECRLMVHAGTIPMGDDIDQRTVIAIGASLARTNLRYAEVLAERTGTKLDVMSRWCNDETYFTANEALKAGFIDTIMPYADPAPEKPQAKKTRKRK